MCTLFATACVKREFFTSNDLHTARSGPDPIQAKSYFCSIKGEGNTSTGGLLFVELGGTAIAGIKPKLRSFVSLKLSPVELARSLYQAPKHFQAWQCICSGHGSTNCFAHLKFPCNLEHSGAQQQQPKAPGCSSGLSQFICSGYGRRKISAEVSARFSLNLAWPACSTSITQDNSIS